MVALESYIFWLRPIDLFLSVTVMKVIICVNLGAFVSVFTKLRPKLLPETIVIDIGSVKEKVENLAAQILHYPDSFIPCHPIAGSEKSGIGQVQPNMVRAYIN